MANEENNRPNNIEKKGEFPAKTPPKIPGLSELENISEEKWKIIFRHFRIGEHMLQRKLITVTQLAELLEEQKETGEQLGEMVIRKGIITRKDLLELLHWQHKADQFIMNILINIERDDTEG
ncbi:MAG: hypothetical protein AB1782_11235 [Cyanobacteriota bacterium]